MSNLENTIIKRSITYLISKDLLILVLFTIQLFFNFFMYTSYKLISISILGISLCFWIFSFIRLLIAVYSARNDEYLKTAFKDEFFKNIGLKSCFYAFIAMMGISVIFIFVFTYTSLLSISTSIPNLILCEAIIFTGIIVSDISKIKLSGDF